MTVSLLHGNSGYGRKRPPGPGTEGLAGFWSRPRGTCATLEWQGWQPWFLIAPGEHTEAPPGSLYAHPTGLQFLAPRGGGMGVTSRQSPWLGSHCGQS